MEKTTINALALLPLPDLTDLSEPQQRGKTCVWCAGLVFSGTAVDLGARRIPLADGFFAVFPRACRPCVAKQACRTLRDHAPKCAQCGDNPDECETGRALYRLGSEYRR